METAIGVICTAALVVIVVTRGDEKWMDRAIVGALLMLAGVAIAAISLAA